MNKQQKEIIKRINKAYSKLYILSNITWTPYRDDLFKMIKKEEKQHRSGDWSKYHQNSASVNDCSRMFTVKYIAENLLKPDLYEIKDLLNIKKSCLSPTPISITDNNSSRTISCCLWPSKCN